LRI
jgi:hypothetical protein